MFIELPNETRVNIDHIVRYNITDNNSIHINLIGAGFELINHDSVEGAKQTIIALDRAVGIKPLMIRK